ncbi:MAG TPA: hypothetical protein VGH86_02730 [Phenylobacterium sp.]
MSLDDKIRSSLTLPAICAPMFLVTGPALVREACKAGVIGGLPRQNARSLEEFEGWLAEITLGLDEARRADPAVRIAPIAVNYPTRMAPDELAANMALCAKYGVEIIISVGGDPPSWWDACTTSAARCSTTSPACASPRRPSPPEPTASTA